MENFNTGLILDPRKKSEKKKDWKDIELAGSTVVGWEEKTKWTSYTKRNQGSSFTCVAQAFAKALEVNNVYDEARKVVFSASFYEERANKGEGMWLQDAMQILKNNRFTTEKRIPSQNINSDAQIEKNHRELWDDAIDGAIASKYGIEAYTEIVNHTDIDTIAGHIQAKRTPVIIVWAEGKEYKEFPSVLNKNLNIYTASIRHAITAVDYGLIDGVKHLKVEDSAHFGGFSSRWISEDFLKARCYGAGVTFDKDNNYKPQEITYNFKRVMVFGERSADVKILQDVLKLEGFFPVTTESTGYYGEITKKAVEKFQYHHQVASIWELVIVGGKRVGGKTLAVLNERYNK